MKTHLIIQVEGSGYYGHISDEIAHSLKIRKFKVSTVQGKALDRMTVLELAKKLQGDGLSDTALIVEK